MCNQLHQYCFFLHHMFGFKCHMSIVTCHTANSPTMHIRLLHQNFILFFWKPFYYPPPPPVHNFFQHLKKKYFLVAQFSDTLFDQMSSDTSTDIATYRLNQPRGQFRNNLIKRHYVIYKYGVQRSIQHISTTFSRSETRLRKHVFFYILWRSWNFNL